MATICFRKNGNDLTNFVLYLYVNLPFVFIIFRKNGNIVGSFPKEIKGALFPTIAVHSQNEE